MALFGVGGIPPFSGNYFWVNEASGSDGNTGGPQDPFSTLTQALSRCTSGNSDVVFLVGSVHTTATTSWNKNFTHLIGLTAPSQNNRARISSTGATPFSPLVNVTGNGCIFQNIATFHGGFTTPTGSQVCWNDAGGRNFYDNVQFLGGGDLVAAALAGMRSLTITGADENVFKNCTIGLDTIVRATNANASLELLSGSARTKFEDCIFQADVSAITDVHVLVASGGMDRWALFKRCTFLNAVNSGGSAMSVGFTVNASAGGSVLLQECASVGATVYATTGPIYVQGSVPTGATSGLAVAAT
jgi:hypothetical protein